MTKKLLEITSGKMTLGDLETIYKEPVLLKLDNSCWRQVRDSAACVRNIVDSGSIVYGINTGFGRLAQQTIPPNKLKQLQHNLVVSHAAGTGPLIKDEIVRLIISLKANSLARGFSGVRPIVIETLLKLLEHDIYPCIPAKGSVGASGDLAPLAHMAACLIGVGDARLNGDIIPATEALAAAGMEPLELGPKEGLALLNGTQVSTALAIAGLLEGKYLFGAAMVAGSLSLDAAMGTDAPFDARIHEARGQKGQIDAAAAYRAILKGSKIRESHVNCEKVQDPYSLRCQPQVMGACLDQLRFAARILTIEANSVSDNPLVFAAQGDVLSGGNFHAEPIALAADNLAIAIAEIGSISERRIAMLIDTSISDLPAFLVEDAGVNSGFMIAHVTAAALTSENKQKSHPASVDSLPTSANQEDHVSMATHGARRLLDMVDNAHAIVAIELLAAAQGIEFHRPFKSSDILEKVHADIRERVAPYTEDRFFAPDIERIKQLVTQRRFLAHIKNILPSLEEMAV